ncbi:unnamed protein product [marine sediment metagenome]|uniref:Uncharacterized protein n=1 Tax=marine sediment metagenome TaxID=412755 RepID=X1Q430_9ZZZZ
MEQERDAKEYAWKWITADELLCPTACGDNVKASPILDYNLQSISLSCVYSVELRRIGWRAEEVVSYG